MSKRFDTPQDAEDAFYDAFEAKDLETMARVWAKSDEITCIHPMSPVLQGREAVLQSWRQIFSSPAKLTFLVHHKQWIETEDLALHVVEQTITEEGQDRQPVPPMAATNVYRHSPQGWRMVLHHVSPPPPPVQVGPNPMHS